MVLQARSAFQNPWPLPEYQASFNGLAADLTGPDAAEALGLENGVLSSDLNLLPCVSQPHEFSYITKSTACIALQHVTDPCRAEVLLLVLVLVVKMKNSWRNACPNSIGRG